MRKSHIFTFAWVLLAAIIFLPQAHAAACIPDPNAVDCVWNDGGQYLFDNDCDCVLFDIDNCPYDYNPVEGGQGQPDADGDGIGDACEDVPVNDPPVWSSFVLPQLSCNGQYDIDIRPYVSDDHDSDAQLALTAQSTNPNVIVTEMGHGVFRIRHTGGNDASATIRFYAEDTGGELSTVSKYIYVDCEDIPQNDPPVWSSFNLPDPACDGQFDFDVRPYVSDDHDSDAQLSLAAVSNDPYILVSEVSHGVFRIRHVGGQDADARITFTAVDTDGEGSSVNKYVVVDCEESPVDEPPVWTDFSLPILACDGFFQKDIKPFVSDDKDSDAQLILTAESDNAGVVVTEVSHGVFKVRHVSGEDESATVTFTAIDTAGLSAYTQKYVVVDCEESPVNAPPVWSPFTLPPVACDGYADVDIKPFVSDDHDSDYALDFYAESSDQNIRVVHRAHGVFRISHLGGADAAGTITFTAEDTGGLQASVAKSIVFDCASENHAPRFTVDVSWQTVSCNQEFSPIPLRDMVEDPDAGDVLTFSVQGADEIPVDVRDGIAYLTNPHENVQDTMTFFVSDGSLSDSSTATFRVQGCEGPVNEAPVWTPFDLPQLACLGSFDIDVRPYVSDDRDSDAELVLTAESSSAQITVSQVSHGVLRVRHVAGDHVSASITLRARDTGGLVSSVVASMVVDCEVPVNHPPVLNVPPISLACQETRPLDLEQYVYDPDGDALTFSVSEYDPNSVINLLRDPFRVQSLGEAGVGYLDVRVSDGYNPPVNQRVRVTVSCGPDQNHPPQFAQIPSQRISCDEEFNSFDLDNYAHDPDEDALTYSYQGNDLIGVTISPDGFVALRNPGRDVKEYITFSAEDPDGLLDYVTATFEVYGCEDDDDVDIELDIPDQSVCYGDRFDEVDLDDYVDYGEGDYEFSVSGEDDLDVYIDYRNRLEVDYPEGFIGSETLRFRVEDEEGNVDRQDVRFRVRDCGYGILPPPIRFEPYVPTIRFVEFKPTPEPNTQCLIQDRLTGKTYPDFDCDDVPDDRDNCPDVPNRNQLDKNKNGVGDACDLVLSYFEVVPDWVRQGESFTVKAGLRNKFGYDLEDVKLTLRIEGLGITQAKNIPSLMSGETEDLDFLVDIPECAEEQAYAVKLSMDSRDRDVVIATGKITVVEGKCFQENRNVNIVDLYNIQDVPVGGSAIYPLKITNTDSYAKSYTLRLVGVEGWGAYSFDTGSVVILPPFTEMTVNAYVYANADALSGDKAFMAEIRHANEVEQVMLAASVKAKEASDLALSIRILQVVLGMLVVAGIVVGIAYLVAQRRADAKSGRSYS